MRTEFAVGTHSTICTALLLQMQANGDAQRQTQMHTRSIQRNCAHHNLYLYTQPHVYSSLTYMPTYAVQWLTTPCP